ncbi:permease [Aliagarivorans taiwanensis]|uniref:permease n=1 Tax=Aliagarivorans taiwanensis TaxID=561966 RepID=UPI0004066A64|nr:permease [Aliagarivorans taiwanensis]
MNIDPSLTHAAGMWLFLAAELSLLFLAISYLVGILQHYIPPAKIRQLLSSQGGRGYLFAAGLGAITPFCSCSTTPFLKGLLRAQASFGTMLVFLFASPLLNPVIIGLLAFSFGVQVTALYFAVALGVSLVAGWLLEKLGFERFVREQAYAPEEASTCASASATSSCAAGNQNSNQTSCGASSAERRKPDWRGLWQSTWKDFRQALPYLLIGISVGSLIYGFVPTELIARYAGTDNLLAIPFAAVVGIPLYVRAEAVIPLSAALIAKGASTGALMALIIGSAGASLTEVILLKSLFKNPLIAAFVGVVLSMAIAAGVAYTLLF